LENKVVDIVDARCNHEVYIKYFYKNSLLNQGTLQLRFYHLAGLYCI